MIGPKYKRHFIKNGNEDFISKVIKTDCDQVHIVLRMPIVSGNKSRLKGIVTIQASNDGKNYCDMADAKVDWNGASILSTRIIMTRFLRVKWTHLRGNGSVIMEYAVLKRRSNALPK